MKSLLTEAMKAVAGKLVVIAVLFVSPSKTAASAQTASSSCTGNEVSFRWVLLDDLYYWIGNATTNFDTAKCLCNAQLPNDEVHLAYFNASFSRQVGEYLIENHPNLYFWLDAQRASDTERFRWPMNCPVPRDSSAWVPGEPSDGDTHLQIKKYMDEPLLTGRTAFSQGVPLCQSAKAPASYLPAPLILEEVMLESRTGNHTFGFSEEKLSFADSRLECDRQPGLRHLATLDKQFKEVTDYVFQFHFDQEFWVAAFRPDTSSRFRWSNGLLVDPGFFGDNEPDSDELVAALDKQQGDIKLAGKSHPDDKRYFVCEGVPETSGILLEWTTLGPSGQMFGFSMTPSQGFDWAKEACDKEAGDVRLASLEDMELYSAVVTYIADNHPDRNFWVNAYRASDNTPFYWADGSQVDNSTWAAEEPNTTDTAAYLGPKEDGIQLAARTNRSAEYFFICQGRPATVELTQPVYDECTGSSGGGTSQTEETTTDAPQTTTEVSTEMSAADSTVQGVSTVDATTSASATVASATVQPAAPPDLPDCRCSCLLVQPPARNVSRETLLQEVQEEAKKIQKELIVDTKNLSATVRKKTSAEDSRGSAQVTGAVGVALLSLVFGSIILPDTVAVVHAGYKAVSKLFQDKSNRVTRLDLQQDSQEMVEILEKESQNPQENNEAEIHKDDVENMKDDVELVSEDAATMQN